MARLANKIAFITGGASGIGLASANMMVKEGAKVVLADRNIEGARAAAAALGDAAIAVALDVTNTAQWDQAIAQAVARFGGFNVLLHSAGVGVMGTVEDATDDAWRMTHAVNVDGVFFGTRAALKVMRPSAPGSIIILSSIAGIIAGHNMAAYNSSKAAVRHLSKSIALHCARKRYDIRCNSVHPTFIDTPMVQAMFQLGPDPLVVRQKLEAQIPLGRLGHADEIAHGIVFLASDESSFMTGSELVLDGGVSAQ